jgi:hypothetical protein
VVFAAASDWDEANVQSALAEFVRPGLTANQYGIIWQPRSEYQQLDGLWPLVASVRGKILFVGDDPELITAMLSNLSRKPSEKPALYLAGLNHARERANFARFSSVVDRPNLDQSNGPGGLPSDDRQPQFFSENMASLSSTLAGISSEHVAVRSEGDKLLQTVTYEWAQ